MYGRPARPAVTNTQIPACIWFLTKNKKARSDFRDRSGETLFIDARNLGYMKDRVLRDFDPKDTSKIAGTFQSWKRGTDYNDEAGFCKSVKLKDIAKSRLRPDSGRYVGAPEEEDDGEPFADKIQRLTQELSEQFAHSAELEAQIKKNLSQLGFKL